MAAQSGSTSSVPSLPPPCPKSPPEYPDLYGKRRETAKVQLMEREIGFLEEELKSIEGLNPASKYCKEVADFVLATSDPLIPMNRKNRRSCRFWKWLCRMPCFNCSWISWICCCCCYSGCSIRLQLPRCCKCNNPCSDCDCNPCSGCNLCRCNLCDCNPCACCAIPKCCCAIPKCLRRHCCCCCCCCCSCPPSNCCKKISCNKDCCCVCRFPSCPDCSCSCFQWKCPRPKCPKVCLPKCPNVRLCCSCKKTCCCTCNPCCLFF